MKKLFRKLVDLHNEIKKCSDGIHNEMPRLALILDSIDVAVGVWFFLSCALFVVGSVNKTTVIISFVMYCMCYIKIKFYK